jgi:hypothetical protein
LTEWAGFRSGTLVDVFIQDTKRMARKSYSHVRVLRRGRKNMIAAAVDSDLIRFFMRPSLQRRSDKYGVTQKILTARFAGTDEGDDPRIKQILPLFGKPLSCWQWAFCFVFGVVNKRLTIE